MYELSYPVLMSLMNGELEEGSPLVIKAKVAESDLENVSIYQFAKAILEEAAAPKGMKLTAKGNLNTKFLEALIARFDHFITDAFQREYNLPRRKREDEWREIHSAHLLLKLCGFVRKSKTNLLITKKGKAGLADPQNLYTNLLRTSLYKFNWGYFDLFPDSSVQGGANYLLFLFEKYGAEAQTVGFYQEKYLQFFANELKGFTRDYSSKEEQHLSCLEVRFFERFGETFGLVEILEKKDFRRKNPTIIQKTALFDKVFELQEVVEPMTDTRMHNPVFELIEGKEFANQEDLQKFLNGLVGKTPEELQKMMPKAKSPAEKANLLVREARQAWKEAVRTQKLEEALALDSTNVEACLFKGELSNTPERSLAWYQKAIKRAESDWGAAKMQEMKGHFWGIHETRPYMTALMYSTSALMALKEYEQAVVIFQKLLDLNPNDNQGCRYILLPLLIALEHYEKAEKLLDQFDDDYGIQWFYDRAILYWFQEGATTKSKTAAYAAFQRNPIVMEIILGEREQAQEEITSYQMESPEEAQMYVNDSMRIYDSFGKLHLVAWLAERYIDFVDGV